MPPYYQRDIDTVGTNDRNIEWKCDSYNRYIHIRAYKSVLLLFCSILKFFFTRNNGHILIDHTKMHSVYSFMYVCNGDASCKYLCMYVRTYVYSFPCLGIGVDVCSSLNEQGHHLRVTIISSYHKGSRPNLSQTNREISS